MKASSDTRRMISRGIIALAVCTFYLSPVAASAAKEGTASAEAAQALKVQNECSRVNSFGQEALTNINSRLTKLQADGSSDSGKRIQQQQAYDAKVASDRAHWDQVRDENFAKLTANSKTSAQKQAVSAFEQSVLAAVATRRASVDRARDSYRTTISNAAASHLSQTTRAAVSFKESVQSAVAQAQSSCTTTAAATVKSTFVAALKQARQHYQAALSAVPKSSSQMSQAAQTREQAIKQADNTFQLAVQQAVKTLKAALGQ